MRASLFAVSCLVASAGLAARVDSSYVIVTPDRDRVGISENLANAAGTLKEALKEGAGLDLKVVEARKFSGGKAIFLGEAAAKAAGLVPEGMKDFSSVIAEKGGSIYLFGCDRAIHPKRARNSWRDAPMPTVKAVARFMEDYMDVRFLMPGDVGTDIPKIEKVEVPDGTFSRHDPRFEFDRYSWANIMGSMLYDYANGCYGSGRYYVGGGHTYPKACPPSKYFKDHPEYFGLFGGRRSGSNEKNPSLCISNPHVQDLIADRLKQLMDDGCDIVELGQNDGWRFCECEACKALGGPGAEYIGEKIWILHRNIAERLLKERPGKAVLILCYSATLHPPKTFKKFPANVMIELCHVSPMQFEEWKGYEVPLGFTAYIYLWGGYQPLGLTPKRSWMHCRDFAKRMVDNRIRGIFRCGYGELFGLEGPTYWVFNHALENPDLDVLKTVDEYCTRAFGPTAGPQMRSFYETLDRRLRGINLMEGPMDCGAIRPTNAIDDAQISNPYELLAFVYAPDVLKKLESRLAYAERHVDTPKRKKRLELVRKEFEYAKALGRIATLYATYRTAPSKGTLEPMLEAIEARERYLDGLFSGEGGKMATIEGWPELKLFRNVSRDSLQTNGRLLALLGAPIGWDAKLIRESGVLPGERMKSYSVPRTAAEPPARDFESGEWTAAEWADLDGVQMERMPQKARFKVLAGTDALYVAMESDLPDAATVDSCGRDGVISKTENCDILVAPSEETDRRCHYIFAPFEGAFYDARCGYIKDPLDPYFRKEDARWNGDATSANSRGGGKWRIRVRIPYSDLGATPPNKGDVWRFNIGRDTNKNASPSKPALLLWNPNMQSRSFVAPDAMGRLEFK